ncbi:hypothetical protein ACJIZ3_019384 [Penstemon smallii]|uniref:Uncharacterized protein n=1 Tax=Penstemon smallii TaxID=265156 RepID=A0ABD3T106_9LAMI
MEPNFYDFRNWCPVAKVSLNELISNSTLSSTNYEKSTFDLALTLKILFHSHSLCSFETGYEFVFEQLPSSKGLEKLLALVKKHSTTPISWPKRRIAGFSLHNSEAFIGGKGFRLLSGKGSPQHALVLSMKQAREDLLRRLLTDPRIASAIDRAGMSSHPSSISFGINSLREPFPTKSSIEKEAIILDNKDQQLAKTRPTRP